VDWHALRGGGLAGNHFGVGALRAEAGIKRRSDGAWLPRVGVHLCLMLHRRTRRLHRQTTRLSYSALPPSPAAPCPPAASPSGGQASARHLIPLTTELLLLSSSLPAGKQSKVSSSGPPSFVLYSVAGCCSSACHPLLLLRLSSTIRRARVPLLAFASPAVPLLAPSDFSCCAFDSFEWSEPVVTVR
jgi:hypothetical protein